VTSCGDDTGTPITCTPSNNTVTVQQPTAPPTEPPTAPPTAPPTGATAAPTGATAAPTGAAGTATPTPAGLPPTGGADDGSSSLPWLLAVIGVSGAAAAVWATMRVRRVKA
jgi:hypothetical protein